MARASLSPLLVLVLAGCGQCETEVAAPGSERGRGDRRPNVVIQLVEKDLSAWAQVEFEIARQIYTDQVGIPLEAELREDLIPKPVTAVSCQEFAESHSTPVPGVVNVYYWPLGDRGETCGPPSLRNVVWIGLGASPTTLTHEFGHVFSLSEMPCQELCDGVEPGGAPREPNLMCFKDHRKGFTEAQAFWMEHNMESAWNWLGLNPVGEDVRCCAVSNFARSGLGVRPGCDEEVACPGGMCGEDVTPEEATPPRDGETLLMLLRTGPTDEQIRSARRALRLEADRWRGLESFPGEKRFVRHYLGNWRRAWRFDILEEITRLPAEEAEPTLGLAAEQGLLERELIDYFRENPNME